MRHPVYLGALLIWSGLSLCFLSYVAAAITALYVIPAYVLYIRSEERMMLDTFGDQHAHYRGEGADAGASPTGLTTVSLEPQRTDSTPCHLWA